jgi:hypothetical protein
MKNRDKRYFSILLLCALIPEVGHARDICVEGIYSSIGEAQESGDMFGESLIVIDQSHVLNLEYRGTGKWRKVSLASGIYSCTNNNAVTSDLVRLEIAYPKFNFSLDMRQRCVPENLRLMDGSTSVAFSGEFTGKGIRLSSQERKTFLPRTKSYCSTSDRKKAS